MENSSKALLIAAAILIVVLLVTISIKILSKPTEVIGQAQGVQDSMSTTSKDAIEHIQSPFDKTGEGGSFAGDLPSTDGDSSGDLTVEGTTPGEGNNGNGENEGTVQQPIVISWTQDKTTVSNGLGTTLQVGEYVNYVSGVSNVDAEGWQILGAKDGKILLLSKCISEAGIGGRFRTSI